MSKTPEEMYYEWRQAFDESLDERMCKGEPIELQLLHRELGKETFLAGYNAGYTAGFDGCLKIQEAVTEHLEKQMVEEMYVRMEPLLKEDK